MGADKFQSPCGERVVKVSRWPPCYRQRGSMFQSPCGERVVKAAIRTSTPITITSKVSIPLRGKGCESLVCFHVGHRILIVSIPLRGKGCESLFAVPKTNPYRRPCVSIPLRGKGCGSVDIPAYWCFYNKEFQSPCGERVVKVWTLT